MIYIIDSIIWTFNKILPGKILIELFIIKKWNFLDLKVIKKHQILFLNYILINVNKIQRKKIIASNCLSLSITTKLLLDLIKVPCNFHLGFTLNRFNKKIPHAWITDLTGKKNYTFSLNSVLIKTYFCNNNV